MNPLVSLAQRLGLLPRKPDEPASPESEGVEARMQEVTRELQQVRAEVRRLRSETERSQAYLQTLLRGIYAGPDVPYPQRLTAQRFSVLSQGEEDGMTLAIFREIGAGSRRFVDIGCADHGWNTGLLADEFGWCGLMIDGNAESVAATRRRFNASAVHTLVAVITAENINRVLREHGFATDLDLLSIDVDGNDYWLWEALDAARPRLVIIEYNAVFGPSEAVVVPYEAGRLWEGHARERRYFGASLTALQRLATRKGYRLIATEPQGTNAFFLRDDVGPAIPGVDAATVFRPQRKYRVLDSKQSEDIFAFIAREKLALVRIPE
jgi:hypothetical protein